MGIIESGLTIIGYKPLKHQDLMFDNALRTLNTAGGHAFFCEMGTGKTYSTVQVIRALCVQHQRMLKVLVVCPKSVIGAWIKDTSENSRIPVCSLVESSSKLTEIVGRIKEHGGMGVINFDQLKNTKDFYDIFDMVVVDESSKIKSPSAERTKLCLRLFKNTRYKIILSGTPITKSVLDLYTQITFIGSTILNHSNYYSFRARYCTMGGFKQKQVVGSKNIDELKEKIKPYITELKKEDCLDLPDKIYTYTSLEMSDELKKQYKEMRTKMVVEYSEGQITASQAVEKAMRLSQILSGIYLKGPNPKMSALMEHIETILEADHQVVVWCHFKQSFSLIADELDSNKIRFASINGETKDRQAEIDLFQSGKVKVFLASINAADMGVTLTAGNYHLYYENNYKMESRKQSEDRIHRIGQKKVCQYIDLVYKGTMDEKVLKSIQDKQDFATSLIDSFKKGRYLEAISE